MIVILQNIPFYVLFSLLLLLLLFCVCVCVCVCVCFGVCFFFKQAFSVYFTNNQTLKVWGPKFQFICSSPRLFWVFINLHPIKNLYENYSRGFLARPCRTVRKTLTFDVLEEELAVHLPVRQIDDALEHAPLGRRVREAQRLACDAVREDDDEKDGNEEHQVRQLHNNTLWFQTNTPDKNGSLSSSAPTRRRLLLRNNQNLRTRD